MQNKPVLVAAGVVVRVCGSVLLGLFVMRPWFVRVILLFMHEPQGKGDFYYRLYLNPVIIWFSMILGSVLVQIAWLVVGQMLETVWRKLKGPGYVAGAPACESTARLEVCVQLYRESAESADSGVLFEMRARVDKLADFFHKENKPALVLRAEDGAELKLSRATASAYADDGKQPGHAPLLVSLRKDGKVFYCFESVDAAHFKHHEDGADGWVYCRLTFPGMEGTVVGFMKFSGLRKDINRVFSRK